MEVINKEEVVDKEDVDKEGESFKKEEVIDKEDIKENAVEEMDYPKQKKEIDNLMFCAGAFLGRLNESYCIIPSYLLVSKNFELLKNVTITLDSMLDQMSRFEYVCNKYGKDKPTLEDIKKKMEITHLECEDSLEYLFTFSIMKNNENLLKLNHNNISIIKHNKRIKIEDRVKSCQKFYQSFIDLKKMISSILDHMHKTRATNFFGMEDCLKKLMDDFIGKIDKEFELLNKLLEMNQAFNIDDKKYSKLCDCDLSTDGITKILNSN